MALSFLSPKLYEIQFSPLKSGSHNPFLGGLWGGCRDCDECIAPAASGGRCAVRGNSRTDPGATTPVSSFVQPSEEQRTDRAPP